MESQTLRYLQFALWALLAVPSAGARPSPSATPSSASLLTAQNQTTRNPHGPLNIPCENCHTAAGWRPIRPVPEFDHNKTSYPLRGMHEKVNCTQCHVKPVFTDVGKNCADCHADIHRRQMGSDCAQCHTVKGWDLATQQVKDHQNRFPLFGAHAAVPCESCHTSAAVGQFLGLSTQCDSCHLKDWRNTTNPPHASAGSAFASSQCATCHSFDSWLGAKFDHSTTGFLLTNGHANLACSTCHINNNYTLTSGACQNCHLTTWQQTNNPPHQTSGPAFAAANCAGCHNTISWNTATFDHSTTGFLLTNGHANVPCASCHVNNNYNLQIAPTDCGHSGCHFTTWQQTNNPPHQASGAAFGVANCSFCHNTTNWTSSTFDHSTTGFLLTDGHANVACAACHGSNDYTLQIAPTDCGNATCHLTTWKQTTTPVHSSSGPDFVASNCANCHTPKGWNSASFDHRVTGFALIGTHASTPCANCHINNNYGIKTADCMSCHTPAWNSTNPPPNANVPNHITSNFPNTPAACSSCHTITVWADGKFDHSSTGFPLTNSHQLVANGGKVPGCSSCHISGNYSLTTQPTDCGNANCHATTWSQTNNPTHSTAGNAFVAGNCSTCHDTIAWTDVTFNHAVTGWPLTGAHQAPPAGVISQCTQCHVGNNYTFTQTNTDCYGCHQAKYASTSTMGGIVPDHVKAGLPTNQCSTCHNTISWTSTWNHSSTGFTLVGTHSTTPCTGCHIANNYQLNSNNIDCLRCHQAAWNSTSTFGGNVPDHIQSNFPATASACAACHTITVWADGKFDHSTTGWPLTGGHVVPSAPPGVQQCSDCHVSGNYKLNSSNTDCYGCHQATYNSTATMGGTVPNHVSAGFPTTQCSTCHNTASWKSTWNHSSTGFALVGTHATTPCVGCHVGNSYYLNSTNTDCLGCHLSAWNSTNPPTGANVPNHVTANFPNSAVACSGCHTISVWSDGKFDHSTTGWALTGGHIVPTANGGVQACSDCHIGGNYTLTAANTVCYGCHVAQWNSTQTLGGSVPNHISAGFPTTCDTAGCHTTTSWLGATFNHTNYFQIPHHGSVCNDCHQVSTNFASFTCINCHTQTAHQQTQTNNTHQGVNGYSYGPTTCYNCHKNGGGG